MESHFYSEILDYYCDENIKSEFVKYFDEKYYQCLYEMPPQALYNEDSVKYIVHLKDNDVVITRSQLSAYFSTLINDMIESDSEIYLDLTLDEFNDPSIENLSYLNSKIMAVKIQNEFFKKQTLFRAGYDYWFN